MNRIATAILIVAAVVALNAGMLRDVFARELPVQAASAITAEAAPAAPSKSKVLSLLLILEALRQTPVALDGQKV